MLIFIGASHHHLEIGALERLTSGAANLTAEINRQPGSTRGFVVLATCNRLEIYLDATEFHDSVGAVTAAVASTTGLDLATVTGWLEVRFGTAAIEHLFSVASGLDSMVLGEAEIAGQVRLALARAQDDRSTTPLLERLFQTASRVSRRVSSNTNLGASGRSIVAVALDITAAQLGSLADKHVLLLGTGAYARVALAALRAQGCERVSVFSASGSDRAREFAASHDVEVVTELGAALQDCDVVVASSGVHGTLLDHDHVAAVMALRSAAGRTAPLPIVDLALPRDVSPEVAAVRGVTVIDLEAVREAAVAQEAGSLMGEAHGIVVSAAHDFEQESAARALAPAVVALRTHVYDVMDDEVARVRASCDENTALEVEKSLRRLAGALLHTPAVRAREVAIGGQPHEYTQALQTLFGIEMPEGCPVVSNSVLSPTTLP
ncbi:glutamyl-tRNA reductase [Micrococcales bacterium 31B]|nr:glutamyl-tRNA reductase [Micrococcales bacterium 31B]